MATQNNDQVIQKLIDAIGRLERTVAYLERENVRRKNDINSMANAFRRLK